MTERKRKKVVVSMERKLMALQRIDNGETLTKIAREYGVGDVTVGDWKRKRQDIEKWCSQKAFGSAIDKRKTMKTSDYEDVGQALFLWFLQRRDKGTQITGAMLQEKALSFFEKFKRTYGNKREEFSASNGWLSRWKKRYGIRQWNVCSENLSSFAETVSMSDEEEIQQEPKISHSEGLAAMETALRYLEQQPSVTATDLLVFKRWRDHALKNWTSAFKQKV